MNTIRLNTNEDDIRRAGEIIRAGGLVAFPTETVYGLGADALNAEAVASVYRAKGRPSDNPMIVHIAEISELDGLTDWSAAAEDSSASLKGIAISNLREEDSDASQLSGMMPDEYRDVFRLADAFWPGPLTLVLRKNRRVPDVTTGGLDTVAVRMPSNATARALILESGRPIAAPSANLSGRPSPTTAEDVLEDMDGRIDAVIMGEQCDVGIESTVLDMTGDVPTILRPGIITPEMLEGVLCKAVVYDSHLLKDLRGAEIDTEKAAGTGLRSDAEADPDSGAGFKPRSPGMKYRHYSPKARVRLIEGSQEAFRERARELGLEARRDGLKAAVIDYDDDARSAAHRLFADLRELDRQNYDVIFIHTLEKSGFGFSVMNRMLRSAGYDVIK